MRLHRMDERLDQFLRILNRHKVALGGLAVAMALGSVTGGFLKPRGLLAEPMAAQLISSTAEAAAIESETVATTFPADLANRPWVLGTDLTKPPQRPPLSASYGDSAQNEVADEAMPDTTPSVVDHAVDAVAEPSEDRQPSA